MKNKKAIVIAILLICALIFSGVYYFYKPLSIVSFKLKGYDHRVTPHFIIFFMPQNRAEVSAVAKAAEKAYDMVGRDLDYFPEDKTPVVVFPSRESLQEAFGWPKEENTQGVYYRDIIYIQNPKSWIGEEEDLEATFFRKGPMVHEYTHLVVERLTLGNYPLWFTEGVAQYEEKRLTGYTLRQDFSIAENCNYPLQDLMNNFDTLDNVAQAYLQALDMIETMAGKKGVEEIKDIMTLLSRGYSANEIYLQRVG